MKRAIKKISLRKYGHYWITAFGLFLLTFIGIISTAQATAYNGIYTDVTMADGDTLNGIVSNCTVTIPSGTSVTVTGQITISGTVNFVGGGTLIRGGSFSNASMIRVNSGAVLNIGTSGVDGVTIDGNSANVSSNGGGIDCVGGTVNLYNQACLTRHTILKLDPFGGAVFVETGTLNMYSGASITYCSATASSSSTSYGGGGVAIYEGAIFNMYGGTISDNRAPSQAPGTGGGGVYNRGAFNMSGGTISNNYTGRNGGAVHLDGGTNTNKTSPPVMIMTSGLITGNSSYTWAGGIEILGNGGLKISGGKINSNTCGLSGGGGGGGIELDGNTSAGYSNGYLEVSGSAQITGNTCSNRQDNVYIDKSILITGNMAGSIGVTHGTSSYNAVGGVFGTNSGSYTGMENFFCDDKPLVGTLSGTNVIWKSSTTALTGVTVSTNSPVTGTAITCTLIPSGASATYQWYRNASASNSGGELIVGATEIDYTPTSADVGKYLYVVANGTGGCTGKVTSAATAYPVQYGSKVETPVFSVTAGTYNASQSVEISCATSGADIYYTTNGAAPTTGSTKYTGAINISSTTTIKAIAIKDGSAHSDVASAAYTILVLTATPYSADYDGAAHAIVSTTGTLAGDTVTFSEDGTTFVDTCPQYTDAGNYHIYVKVTRADTSVWESGEKTAVIDRATGSITITGDISKTYDGSAVSDPAVNKSGTGTVTFSYYNDDSGVIGTQLSGAPSAVGTYWVKAKVAEDTNYSEAEATRQFAITAASIGDITVTPYTGTYDGDMHNAVTLTGTLDEDVVTYSEDGTSFTDTCPQYANAGTYSIYVKVSRTGSDDWESGLKNAVISRASGTITITGDPSKAYDGSPVTDPAVTATGTGEVTFSYYSDNAGAIETQLSDVPVAAGAYWVKAELAQDTNYTSATTTKMFMIAQRSHDTHSSHTNTAEISAPSVSDITSSGGTLVGNIVTSGGSAVTERGFVISNSPDPEIGGNGVLQIQLPGGTGRFTANADSLMPATLYYVRAYAINSAGISYGESIPLATGYIGDGQSAIPKTGDEGSIVAPVLLLIAAITAGVWMTLCRGKIDIMKNRDVR